MRKALVLLSRPGMHVLLGCVLFVALIWPFVTVRTPLQTWLFLHVAWLVAVGLLLLTGLADRDVPADEADEEQDDG